MASLDITSVYSNILTNRFRNIVRDLFGFDTDAGKKKKDVISFCKLVTKSDYFIVDGNLHGQGSGLAGLVLKSSAVFKLSSQRIASPELQSSSSLKKQNNFITWLHSLINYI